MGQKVHPFGFRLGITETWQSRWYKRTKPEFAAQLKQDRDLRKFVEEKLKGAGVSNIVLERFANRLKVNVRTARPGLVIGKKGKDIEDLRKDIKKLVKDKVKTEVNIIEIRKPDLDARLVAQNVANQLMRRVAFRRATKDAVGRAMRMGAEGVKIAVSGRLGGADIARTEWSREGRVPLHTLRAQIDYGTAEALTTYGITGVKVWIFRGEKDEGIDAAESISA